MVQASRKAKLSDGALRDRCFPFARKHATTAEVAASLLICKVSKVAWLWRQ